MDCRRSPRRSRPDQRVAVTAESHLVAVIAGAGSGKTRVLTRRIAYRIATEQADPRHTLVLTFTREAAGELRRRLTRLGLRDRVEAGTFHSVMLGRAEATLDRHRSNDRTPSCPIAPSSVDEVLDPPQRAASRGTRRRDRLGRGPRHQAERLPASAPRRAQRRPIAGVERCASVTRATNYSSDERGIIDFDDVLATSSPRHRSITAFGERCAGAFVTCLVDEAQDLNPLQHRLSICCGAAATTSSSSATHRRRSIGFNGADPACSSTWKTRFPGVEIVPSSGQSSIARLRSSHGGVHVLPQAISDHWCRTRRRCSGSNVLVGADEPARSQPHRRRRHPHRSRTWCAPAKSPCSAGTNAQLGRYSRRRLEAPRHSASVDRQPRAGTAAGAVRQVATIGSASLLRQLGARHARSLRRVAVRPSGTRPGFDSQRQTTPLRRPTTWWSTTRSRTSCRRSAPRLPP